MKPIKTPFTNQTYVLVGGGVENNLPVMMGDNNGQHFIQSTWELTEEDRAHIAAGAHISLTVYGRGHPPVSLGTVSDTRHFTHG